MSDAIVDVISDFRGQYRWLSNFHLTPIEYEGKIYPSTEHAYQAAKSSLPDVRESFTKTHISPALAKKWGRLVVQRSDWEQVKVQVMYDVCKYKFTHDAELKQKLLDTGDAFLEEGNTWGDTFWGTVNGKGKNHLGMILMAIRTELKNDQ